MQYAFSTLGCSTWDLETIAARAGEYGFEGVDFRGLGETIDVTQTPAFTAEIDATKRTFAEAGVAVSGISTSIGLCEPENRDRHRAEARRVVPAAETLDARDLRVFGRGDAEMDTEELVAAGRETMASILALEGADRFDWNLETHDNWTRSADCERLLDAVDSPNFGVVWDVGHTTRVADERPSETLDHLGERVSYVHLKDATYDPDHPDAMDDGWRYVLPGEGDLPLEAALDALRSRGFDGWVVFEHEKRWHPELADPETAFPRFMEWVEPSS